MQIKLTSPQPPPLPELELDPLAGITGYRVQTDLHAGDCSGGTSDGCAPNWHLVQDSKGDTYCSSSCGDGVVLAG